MIGDEGAWDARAAVGDGMELMYWARGDLRDAEKLIGYGAERLALLRMKTASCFIEAAIHTIFSLGAG